MSKKLLFITASRADYSKIKSLMISVKHEYSLAIFVTGMHMLKMYGSTYKELQKDGFSDALYMYTNQHTNTFADEVLAQTIHGLSLYCKEFPPDMIIVHGDRIESLAGAIVGGLNNILTAHIEGGDLSGTIDESIRHAISKFSHLHFVNNSNAKDRLIAMGENQKNIHVIGSPDLDLMFSPTLPTLEKVKEHYSIPFTQYAIALFHPVTTEYDTMPQHAQHFVDALLESNENYIIISPNNDLGSSFILYEYKRVQNNPRFRLFPSISFESFLSLLKNARYLIGNSSAGMRESPLYNIPTINIGTRQENRETLSNSRIIHVQEGTKENILLAIENIKKNSYPQQPFVTHSGKSAERFMAVLRNESTWNIPIQKKWH